MQPLGETILTPEDIRLDARLAELSSTIRPLLYLKPSNLRVVREKFLTTGELDEFTYVPVDLDFATLEDELSGMQFDESEVGQLLAGVRRRLSLLLQVIKNIGNANKLPQISEALFGRPDSELIEHALNILRNPKQLPVDHEPATISAEGLKLAFEEKLEELGLSTWKVHLSERHISVATSGLSKCLYIPSDASYSPLGKDALIAHEIGTHVLRSENGSLQDLKVLASGCHAYLSTEEGLAVYGQELTGTLPMWVQFLHAGQVVAVDSVYCGLSFEETFDKLMGFQVFDRSTAFRLCMRVFRGGGYLKDHSYLKGYLEIKAFVANGGGLKHLYAGKFALDQLEQVRHLIKTGALSPAKHLPWFF